MPTNLLAGCAAALAILHWFLLLRLSAQASTRRGDQVAFLLACISSSIILLETFKASTLQSCCLLTAIAGIFPFALRYWPSNNDNNPAISAPPSARAAEIRWPYRLMRMFHRG